MKERGSDSFISDFSCVAHQATIISSKHDILLIGSSVSARCEFPTHGVMHKYAHQTSYAYVFSKKKHFTRGSFI